jgi:hypothetical protein
MASRLCHSLVLHLFKPQNLNEIDSEENILDDKSTKAEVSDVPEAQSMRKKKSVEYLFLLTFLLLFV